MMKKLFRVSWLEHICIFIFVLILGAIMFFFLSEWIYPAGWGSYSLGGNIYKIEFDGGPIIVHGDIIRGNTCYGGENIIPTSDVHCDSLGNYVEYVVDTRHNDDWIIVKTYQKLEKKYKYYTIKKNPQKKEETTEDILKSTTMFDDSISFVKSCKDNRINLCF